MISTTFTLNKRGKNDIMDYKEKPLAKREKAKRRKNG